jgi:hypothetical protein
MSLNAIEIEMRDVYGVTKFYPVCEKACVFARIAGTVTLTKETIKQIKLLDYAVIIKVREPQLGD